MRGKIVDKFFGEIEKEEKAGYKIAVDWIEEKVIVNFSSGVEFGYNEKEGMQEVLKAIEKSKVMFQNKEDCDKKMKNKIISDLRETVADWCFYNIDTQNMETMETFIKDISKKSKIFLTEEDVEELKKENVIDSVFKNNIYLDYITFSSEGDFTAYFYDREMFFLGHAISLSGNVNGEFEYEASIVG